MHTNFVKLNIYLAVNFIEIIYFKYRFAQYHALIYWICIQCTIIFYHLVLKLLTTLHIIIKLKCYPCCTLTIFSFYFGLNVDAPYILKHSFLATCKRVTGNRLNYFQGLYLKTLNLINNLFNINFDNFNYVQSGLKCVIVQTQYVFFSPIDQSSWV